MRVKLDHTTVLITGASAGIGEQFARQLAPRVKALLLVARRRDRLESLKKEFLEKNPRIKVGIFPCDVTDFNAVDSLFSQIEQEFGPIDILINNAGMGDISLFEKASWQKLEQMLNLNVAAFTYILHKTAPQMIKWGSGAILAVGSSASLQSLPGFGVYSATKYYVNGLIEALRAELLPAGVVVSQLCPGPVKTEFGQIAAGNLYDGMPDLAEISAEKCARDALRAFAKGKAVIRPGVLIQIAAILNAWIPNFLRRWVLVQIAKRMRRAG